MSKIVISQNLYRAELKDLEITSKSGPIVYYKCTFKNCKLKGALKPEEIKPGKFDRVEYTELENCVLNGLFEGCTIYEDCELTGTKISILNCRTVKYQPEEEEAEE